MQGYQRDLIPVTPGRLFVERCIHDEFVARMVRVKMSAKVFLLFMVAGSARFHIEASLLCRLAK